MATLYNNSKSLRKITAKDVDKTKKDNYMKTVGRSENDMGPTAKTKKAMMERAKAKQQAKKETKAKAKC